MGQKQYLCSQKRCLKPITHIVSQLTKLGIQKNKFLYVPFVIIEMIMKIHTAML